MCGWCRGEEEEVVEGEVGPWLPGLCDRTRFGSGWAITGVEVLESIPRAEAKACVSRDGPVGRGKTGPRGFLFWSALPAPCCWFCAGVEGQAASTPGGSGGGVAFIVAAAVPVPVPAVVLALVPLLVFSASAAETGIRLRSGGPCDRTCAGSTGLPHDDT